MERVSAALGRIMLGILFALLAAAMLSAVAVGMESRSYLLAMALGALGTFVFILLWRRLPEDGRVSRALSGGKTAAWLTLLCFAVHLAWVLAVRIEPFSDYDRFWRTACALASGGGFDAPDYLAVYPHILGYAAFLSLFLRLFGEHVMVGAVLNAALTSISGLLIYLICRRAATARAAAAAYIIWIFMPTKLMLNSLIFSEPLYTCLVLLILLFITELERRQEELKARLWLGVPLGAALGLLLRALNAVRPLAAIIIIAYFIWLLLLRGKALRDGRLWIAWLLLSAAMLGAYSASGKAWDRHIERLLGEAPASLPVYSIYVGFNEETQGQWSAEDMDLLFEHMSEEQLSAQEAQLSLLPELKERLGSGIDYFRLFRSKIFAFLGHDELGGYTYRYTRSEGFVKICMALGNVYYYALAALAFAGIIALWRRGARQSALLLFPLFAVGLTLAHMLIEVTSRYHYSIMPIFIIIAAVAIDNIRLQGGQYDAKAIYNYSLL